MAKKIAILCSTSLAALIATSAPVLGQTMDAEPQPVASTASDPASGTAQDNSDNAAQQPEIVVTGVRASLAEGLQIKREATQVVESVVAEDVGKLPDNNVVEALQRVTGVQVTDRGGGEASTISIRGLPDITTTWNGRNVFTASGRQFALADVPANLVRRIDVYKTRAADQIETGIAGQVDVFTRRPFDFKGFAISGVARGIYDEQADKVNPNVSALVSDRWETGAGEFGALVNVSYSRYDYRDQNVTAGALVPFATEDAPPPGSGAANSCNPSNPNGWTPLERIQPTDCRAPGQKIWVPGLQTGLPDAAGSTLAINGQDVPYYLSRDAVFQNDLTGRRERPAINVALQYAPDSDSEYTFEFFWDGYRNTSFNNLLFSFVDWWGNLGPDPASTFELYDGTNIIKSRTVDAPFNFTSGDLTTQRTDSFVYALSGKWNIGDQLKVKADLSYQTSTFSSSFLAMRTNRTADSVTVDFNSGGGLPAFGFGDNSLLIDPNQWSIGEFYDNANRNKGNAVTFSADGDYEVGGGFLRTLSFGVRYDDRHASEAMRTQDAPALNQPFGSFDSGLFRTNSGFFDGLSDVPRSWVVANGYYIKDHADEIRELYQNSVDPGILTSDQLSLFKNFSVDEFTAAAYLQADMEQEVFGRPLRIQAGARFVTVNTNMVFTDRLTGTRSTASKHINDLLPSATVRYDITDDLRLRFNYGETLRRPNFTDLNPNYNLTGDLSHVGYGTGTGGNPDLEPTKARNYDLSLDGISPATARSMRRPSAGRSRGWWSR